MNARQGLSGRQQAASLPPLHWRREVKSLPCVDSQPRSSAAERFVGCSQPARRRRYPDRNRVMVLLSVKAGLRACEIARLTWPMVTDARGKIGTVLELPARAAKMGGGRRIPIHPDLRRALIELKKVEN